MSFRTVLVALAAVALTSCASQPVENSRSPAAEAGDTPTNNPFPPRGPAFAAIRQIVPGLDPASVRAMLGAPDSTMRRRPLANGEILGPLAAINPAAGLSGGLPPLSPGGEDWGYDRSRQEQVDGRPIADVWQRITVSFDAAGKVEDCRVSEKRLAVDKSGIVYVPSRDRRADTVAAAGEIRCAALRE